MKHVCFSFLIRTIFLAGATGALVLSSCRSMARQENILRYESPEGTILIFPRRNEPPEGVLAGDLLALLPGELTLSGSCLTILEEDTGNDFILIWPPGFTASLADTDRIEVYDSAGNPVASIGDDLVISGGETTILEGFDPIFSSAAQDIVYDQCPGRYWIVGTVDQKGPN